MAGRRLSGRSGPAAVLAALVLAAAGCGSDEGENVAIPETPQRPIAAIPAGDLTPLVGKYRYDADATTPQVAAGAWHLLLGAERFSVRLPTEVTQVGTYSVDGRTVTFVDDSCGDVRGRYRWTREEGLLMFEPIRDGCANRVAILTTLPWHERAPGAPDQSTRQDPAADPP